MTKKIMIIAGEASGDQHAAKLVEALNSKVSDLDCYGMAGPKMRQVGVRALVNAEDMAVMGFVEVLANFVTIYKSYQIIKKAFKEDKPDLVILVDYPGFNFKIAELAKSFGVKVLYYISPQLWAWKKKRIEKVKKFVDIMAVIFPFEEKFYQQFNVSAKYVGSPILESIDLSSSKLEAKNKLHLPESKKIVALLPGSRKIEINRMLPVMLASATRLTQKRDDLHFVLPVASTLQKNNILEQCNEFDLPITLLEDESQLAIRASDAAICTSGTVTLETALLGVPMVVIYKMNPVTFQIAKRLVKVDKIALCNIVAEKKVVKELIQDDANEEKISDEVERILTDQVYAKTITGHFASLRERLGDLKAADVTADLALSLL